MVFIFFLIKFYHILQVHINQGLTNHFFDLQYKEPTQYAGSEALSMPSMFKQENVIIFSFIRNTTMLIMKTFIVLRLTFIQKTITSKIWFVAFCFPVVMEEMLLVIAIE